MIDTDLSNIKRWNFLEHHKSKSGALLSVILQLNENQFRDFYDGNIGFRIYRLTKIPIDSVGANEFHKFRKEIVVIEEGKVKWILEDLEGGIKNVILKKGDIMFYIPPITLHTYTGKSNNSSMTVISSTVYYKNDMQTHDTHSEEEFRKLQKIKLR